MPNTVIDLTGLTFGRWTVLSFSHTSHESYWNCRCQCGTEHSVRSDKIRGGESMSCGCLNREQRIADGLDLAGQQFGRLTVEGGAIREGRTEKHWRCTCQCGAVVVVRQSRLRSGKTSSCGCYQKERQRAAVTKHGHCADRSSRDHQTAEYRAWHSMRERCENPNTRCYKNYGGRGITVCAAWRRSFTRFLADMGLRPSARHSIDRIDNNGPYSPRNCRWATKREQAANRRTRTRLTLNGQTHSLTEWAEITRTKRATIDARRRNGWRPARLLSGPPEPETLTFNGRTLTIREWSLRVHLKRTTIQQRLRYGWTTQRALTTKVRG